MDVSVIDLPSVSLHRNCSVRREEPPNLEVVKDSFWDGYDSTTLVYQAVVDRQARLRLFCPPLYNLAEPLIAALKKAGVLGKRRVIHRKFREMDLLETKGGKPGVFRFELFGEPHELSVEDAETTRFAGKNVLYTQSKNNQLNWIEDWLRYHADTHGANAAIIVDNGSTDYPADALRDVMAGVAGYDTGLVIRAPLPFKPALNSRKGPPCHFFQVGLHNCVRDRWMARARAVLAIDIDELMVPSRKESVFDAAATSRLGAVRFKSTMVYPEVDGPADHAEHMLREVDGRKSHGKYCYRPASYMGRGNLGAHTIHSGIRNPLNLHLLSSDLHHYLHYYRVSTSWKFDRSSNPDVAMEPEPLALEIARILRP